MVLPEIIQDVLEPQKIITTFGLIGVILIVFAETGLFFGFFLPGDSLLFTAGFLASQNLLPLPILLVGTFIAAVVGDSVGYWFGKKTGASLFTREDSRFFKKEYVEKAKLFYEKHGRKTLILARFMPIIRTFAPIVAGVAEMKYKTFIVFNVIGAFIWTFGLTLGGYFLGKVIPDADHYLLPIVILIIFVSILPGIVHILRERKTPKM